MKNIAVVLVCLLGVVGLALAKTGKEAYDAGKSAYDSGRYQEAIVFFQEAAATEPQHYGAKGNYMIALCYKKTGQCAQAKPFFIDAWKHNATDGGASSKAKFIEQIERCGFTVQEITGQSASTEQPTRANPQIVHNESSSNISTWVIIAMAVIGCVFLIWFFRKKQQTQQQDLKTQEDIQTQLDLKEIYHTVFDDSLWQLLSQQHDPNLVSQTQISWQLNYNSLQADPHPQLVQDMLMKVRLLKRDPNLIFKPID